MKLPYQGPDADDTRECPNCQVLNDASARFCDSCGATIPGPASAYSRQPGDVVQCPVCESFAEADANFCSQCGHPIPLGAFNLIVDPEYGAAWGQPASSSGRRPMGLDTTPEGRRAYLNSLDRADPTRSLSADLRDAEEVAAQADNQHARAWQFYELWQERDDGTNRSAAEGSELQAFVNRAQKTMDQAKARVSYLLAEWDAMSDAVRLDRD